MRCLYNRFFVLIILVLFLFSPFSFAASDANSTVVPKTGSSATTSSELNNEEGVSLTSSGFNDKKSYEWLKNASTSRVGSVLEQSLTILALNNKNINVQSFVDVLKTQQEANGCFPKPSCKVTDTAMGMLALSSVGQDVSKSKEYLLSSNSLIPGLKTGEWRLQLDVAGNGTCNVKYGEPAKTKSFSVAGGVIKGASGKYYINVGNELDGSLTSSKVSQSLSVDCVDLTGVVSLVYYLKSTNSFYVLDSQSLSAGSANLKIINGCFRAVSGSGSCDLESTLYSTWSLLESGLSLNEIGTLAYIESSASSTNINDLNKALLVRILQKSGNANAYFDNYLISTQKNGAWGRGDIYTTAYSLFALSKASGAYTDTIQSSTQFLEKRVLADGSWGSVKSTAMTLISFNGAELSKNIVVNSGSSGSGKIPANVDAICAGEEKDSFGRTGCGSPLCTSSSSCKCENLELQCGGNCLPCPEEDITSTDSATNVDNQNLDEPSSTENTSPPKSESSSLGVWIFILVLTLLVAIGGGIYYLKSIGKLELLTGLFSKKPNGPNFETYKKQVENRNASTRVVQGAKPVLQPRPLQAGIGPKPIKVPLRKPSYDDALENSLKEAEKLLKSNK